MVEECPRCKTTKYSNPQMRLLVNECGHALCESCIDKLFVKGAAICYQPDCGFRLKRTKFRTQLFQDSQVEKEIQVRRDILKKFTRKEESFATLRDYNDYLEQIETIIYNLANEIDVEETNKMILNLGQSAHQSRMTGQKFNLEGEPYYHDGPAVIDLEGPLCPSIDEIKEKNYLNALRCFTVSEIAGGFIPTIPAYKALQEAFSGLFVKP